MRKSLLKKQLIKEYKSITDVDATLFTLKMLALEDRYQDLGLTDDEICDTLEETHYPIA